MIREAISENFFLLIFGAVAIFGLWVLVNVTPLPSCAEDDVIVGRGQYYSNGHWQYYACEHIENVK